MIKQLIKVDKSTNTAIYLQITNAFIHNIRQGRLRKGLKLPGSRELATLLQVNRMTAVAAYDELEAQGWIEKQVRKGTFVTNDLPELAPKKLLPESGPLILAAQPHFHFDEQQVVPMQFGDFPQRDLLYFNDGFPDARLAPVDELLRTMRSLSRRAAYKRYLMYGGAQGTVFLRETLANFLRDTRGLAIGPDNLLITRGAQMGIYLTAAVLIRPGDRVIVGEPGFTGANFTFESLGGRLCRVPVQPDGMDIDQVEALCRQHPIRIVYIIPHHHNPTTVTLRPEKRLRLLELAAKYRFAVLEDDYDYDFHYASKPMMPMASLDRRGSVVYIGTLTKILAPAIRVGFVVAPEAFIRTLTYRRKTIDVQGDSLLENAIAAMYQDGSMMRHIKRSVKLYRERRDHFCDLLSRELRDRIGFQVPDGGMSVWVQFLETDLRQVAARALRQGLVVKDGTEYDHGAHRYNAVRLGFASLDTAEQERAVAILRTVMGV